jgi:hypothetical protein
VKQAGQHAPEYSEPESRAQVQGALYFRAPGSAAERDSLCGKRPDQEQHSARDRTASTGDQQTRPGQPEHDRHCQQYGRSSVESPAIGVYRWSRLALHGLIPVWGGLS